MYAVNSEKLIKVWKKLKKNDHFKFGVPFGLLVVGCFFYLNQTQSVKYIFEPNRKVTLSDLKDTGFFKPEKVKNKTLEEIYEEVKDKDISKWENKRIPRPWEE